MSYKLLVPKLLKNRRLIFGLGSGRCGTTSLSYLLNLQKDTEVTHEYHTDDPFNIDLVSPPHLVMFCLIDLLARESKIVGDSSFYWLRHLKMVSSFKGDLRFICLKRDKKATVDSYLKTPVHDKNPMKDYGRKEFNRYYDEYYMWADYYVDKHPDIFRIFDIEDLNTAEGQEAILTFAGFEDPIYEIGIKKNQSFDSGLKDGGIDPDNLEVEELGERANGINGPPPPEIPPHFIGEEEGVTCEMQVE